MGSERDIPGTLFRGADGNLYFIPDTALEPFRVFDDVSEQVEALFDAGAENETEDMTDAKGSASSQLDAIYTTITVHEPDSYDAGTSAKYIVIAYLEETGQ